VLTSDSVTLGSPLPRWLAIDRSELTAAPLSPANLAAHRTSNHLRGSRARPTRPRRRQEAWTYPRRWRPPRARPTGRKRNNKKKGRDYSYLHHAVDDHSRLAYSEILGDERKETGRSAWSPTGPWKSAAGPLPTCWRSSSGWLRAPPAGRASKPPSPPTRQCARPWPRIGRPEPISRRWSGMCARAPPVWR
jgi:hypothetical protein